MIAVNRRYVLAILVVALVGSLLVPELALPPTHFFAAAEDASHGPLFGFVALCALAFLRAGPVGTKYAGRRGYVAAWVVATVLGGLGELAQLPGPRDASWSDFFNDALGAACALFAFACFDPVLKPLPASRVRTFAAASVALAIVIFAPFAWVNAAYLQRRAQLPVLFDPAARTCRVFVFASGADARYVAAPDGRVELEVRLQPGADYPGVELTEPWPDWRGHAALVIEVENPGDTPQPINLNIHDAGHDWNFTDRYNAHRVIPPRATEIVRIPLESIAKAPQRRRMDLSRMNAIVMFGSRVERPAAFRIRGVRLE
jgi:hypothetical protein